jgi:hypothetical protein
MPSYSKFLKALTAVSVTYLTAVFGITFWTDPYGLRTFGGRQSHARLVKAIQVNRLDPEVVFVGSSNVVIGLDPEHTAFDDYDAVYNLGIFGTNFYEIKRYFQHAAFNGNLEKSLIGLDFYGFNQYAETKPGFSESRLNSTHMRPKDFLRLYLSLEALSLIKDADEPKNYFASNGTLMKFINHSAKDREELFRKHLIQNFLEEGGMYHGQYELSDGAIKDFKELVSIARQKDIEIQIFLPPSHVTLFYPSIKSAYWESYQEWLRAIVNIHPVWDFSGCNSITTIPITLSEQYYEDPLHFNSQLGDWIIQRIYDSEENSLPPDFGVYVTSENVNSHLDQVNQQCKLWRQENPEIIEWLENLDLQQKPVSPLN